MFFHEWVGLRDFYTFFKAGFQHFFPGSPARLYNTKTQTSLFFVASPYSLPCTRFMDKLRTNRRAHSVQLLKLHSYITLNPNHTSRFRCSLDKCSFSNSCRLVTTRSFPKNNHYKRKVLIIIEFAATFASARARIRFRKTAPNRSRPSPKNRPNKR